MVIEPLDKTLINPFHIREHKTRLVLDWLHAFRFSSLELLAQRLGSSTAGCRRLFHSLFKVKFIQNFMTDYTYRKRFVMLTSTGARFLHQSAGRDFKAAVTQAYRLRRNHTVIQELAVQGAAIRRLEQANELTAQHHIILPEPFQKPDMLMCNHKDFWFAFAYERVRKQVGDVYLSFNNHAQAIINKHYRGIHFLFPNESDLVYYQNLFDATAWPRGDPKKKRGRRNIIDKKAPFEPDTITNLRQAFHFIHEVP